jgi:hypothetical protein
LRCASRSPSRYRKLLAYRGDETEVRLAATGKLRIDLGQQFGVKQRPMLGAARVIDAVTRAEIVQFVAAARMLAARKRQRIDNTVACRRDQTAFLQFEIDEGHVEARVVSDELRI